MKKLLGLILALSLSSCSIQEEYVKADRETYNLIAPAHEAYIRADRNLTDDQRTRRLVLLDSWRIRIDQAEKD